MKPKVRDEIGGINAIWKLHSTKDVAIFCIDVNSVLKHEAPTWCSFHGQKGMEKREMQWLDPRWKGEVPPGWSLQCGPAGPEKKLKGAFVDFGPEFLHHKVVCQMCRYTCFVVFFKDEILSKGIEKMPVYRSKR